MHTIEPFYRWERFYKASADPLSPFYGKQYDYSQYSSTIYDHYIHPSWDYIGSDTLYIKVLYTHYQARFAVIELLGEWNDAINNDIMHLKRNVLDKMDKRGINKYILLGENVLNFHASDDCYYEEWFDDVEEGWIAALNFRYHIQDQWKKFHLDHYINFGGTLELEEWRTLTPVKLFELVNSLIIRRIG